MSLLLLFNQPGVGPVIVDADTHDGRRQKRRFDREAEACARRKAQIIEAYERLAEGKPAIARELTRPFAKLTLVEKSEAVPRVAPKIDFDRLMASLDHAERLWQAFLDLDDEDVLRLM